MRDHGKEARLGAVCGFRLIARIGERAFCRRAIGHVAADALHLAVAVSAHGDFAPGDPAHAVGAGDFLVVNPRAVGEQRGVALLLHRQRECGAKKVVAAASGERAERVIGIGDGAVAVAAHDDVTLRFEKALGALLGFPAFPITVFGFVKPCFQGAQLGLHLTDTGNKDAHGAA